jgi:glycosyltransferase involved in cell wall biosynthesis
MEGLTAQTIECGGGMLFTNKDLLKQQVIELACNEGLRMEYGERLKHYLENVVSWDVVAEQYNNAYSLACDAKKSGKPVMLPKEW